MSFRKNVGSILGKTLLAALVGTAFLQTPAIEARVLSGSITERKQNRKIDTMLKSARKSYDAGKVQPAIDAYWKILELDPLETFAYLELGEIYVELRIFDRAIELLEPGLKMAEREMDRDTVCYYFCILTNAHLALNQTGLANKTLIKAAEAAPKNPMPRKILGDIYLANNRIADAMKAYRKAVDLDSEYQPAKEKLGELTAKYGDQLPTRTRDKKLIREKAVKLPPTEAKQVAAGTPATTQAHPIASTPSASLPSGPALPPASATIQPNSGSKPQNPISAVSNVKQAQPSAEKTPDKPSPAEKLPPRPMPVSAESQVTTATKSVPIENYAPQATFASPVAQISTVDKPAPAVEATPRPMPTSSSTKTVGTDNKPATTPVIASGTAPTQPATPAPTASTTEIEAQLDKFLAGTPEEKKASISFFVKLEEKGLTEMEELLYDPDPEVRVLAIRALPEFKAFNQRVKTMLNDASEDPDPLVVEEINKALQNL